MGLRNRINNEYSEMWEENVRFSALKMLVYIEEHLDEADPSLLTKVLQRTDSLLSAPWAYMINLPKFDKLATKLSGQENMVLQVIGGMMLALGILVLAAAVTLALFPGLLALGGLVVSAETILSVTGGAGVLLGASGLGLFASGRRSGLADAAGSLGEKVFAEKEKTDPSI